MNSTGNLRLLWLFGGAFVLLSAAAGGGMLYALDVSLIRLVQSSPSDLLDAHGMGLSAFGGLELAAVLLLGLATGLFLKGRGRLAVFLLLAFLATGLVEYLLKQLLPTPPVPRYFVRIGDFVPLVVVEHSYPYPSGHALRSTILLGAAYLLSGKLILRAGIAVVLLGILASRVYLEVHWPSDVAGGALLGAASVLWAFKAESRRVGSR